MSLIEQIYQLELVKVGPSLWERLEARIGRQWVAARLVDFRHQLAQDMEPEPWTALRASAPFLLADLCQVLGLNEVEQIQVLGAQGLVALEERPISSLNERQQEALAHARKHGRIDARAYRRLCPCWSDETLRRDLVGLVAMGLLVKNGRNKGTYYVPVKRRGSRSSR